MSSISNEIQHNVTLKWSSAEAEIDSASDEDVPPTYLVHTHGLLRETKAGKYQHLSSQR